MKDSYKNTFYNNGRELAKSALVLACKELGKDPKETAKILKIDYSGSDDGTDEK